MVLRSTPGVSDRQFSASDDPIQLTCLVDGFLLSQFLSASSNQRSDEFGGSPERRAELVVRILRSVRATVSPTFCVGVKINTADHMNPGGFNDMLRQMVLIEKEKPDYVQLTGGSFEDPQVCFLLLTRTTRRS